MKAQNKKKILLFSLLLLIPVTTMAFADVIYFYSGNITVGLAKTQPITFTYNGQTAGPKQDTLL